MCYHRTMRSPDPGRAGSVARSRRRRRRPILCRKRAGSTTPATTRRPRGRSRGARRLTAMADAARASFSDASSSSGFARQRIPPDLTCGPRVAARSVDPVPLEYRERLELTIGQAEILYLDDRFGAAAELFETSLDRSVVLGTAAHERVLDWWATALDRHAQLRADGGSARASTPGSSNACAPSWRSTRDRRRRSYWLAAAARGAGDLERAWQAAIAGWVRAEPRPGSRRRAARRPRSPRDAGDHP